MKKKIMNPQLKYHYLSGHQLFNNLSREQMLDVCNATHIQTNSKGQCMYFANDNQHSIYLVLHGAFKIIKTDEEGSIIIKEIVKSGDFFGEIGFVKGSHRDEYAIALTKSTITCSLKASLFEGILKSNPEVAMNYVRQMNRKLQSLEDRHTKLLLHDAKTRVMDFFKDWAKQEGKREGNKIVLKNYLTQSDIAAFNSTSRQSVIALLNELRNSGLMMYTRRQIEITNHKWLATA